MQLLEGSQAQPCHQQPCSLVAKAQPDLHWSVLTHCSQLLLRRLHGAARRRMQQSQSASLQIVAMRVPVLSAVWGPATAASAHLLLILKGGPAYPRCLGLTHQFHIAHAATGQCLPLSSPVPPAEAAWASNGLRILAWGSSRRPARSVDESELEATVQVFSVTTGLVVATTTLPFLRWSHKMFIPPCGTRLVCMDDGTQMDWTWYKYRKFRRFGLVKLVQGSAQLKTAISSGIDAAAQSLQSSLTLHTRTLRHVSRSKGCFSDVHKLSWSQDGSLFLLHQVLHPDPEEMQRWRHSWKEENGNIHLPGYAQMRDHLPCQVLVYDSQDGSFAVQTRMHNGKRNGLAPLTANPGNLLAIPC